MERGELTGTVTAAEENLVESYGCTEIIELVVDR